MENARVADLVLIGVERNSLKESLVNKDTDFEELQVTVEAKSKYVGMPKAYLVQQKVSFEKTKAALETALIEAEELAKAVRTERAAQHDHLWSKRSVGYFKLRKPSRHPSAVRIWIQTVSGLLSEQKRLEQEVEQKFTNVQYDLYDAGSTQL